MQKLLAEGLGTALLLATVVGSGIMAENLVGGSIAIALMGTTIPTGAILVVLITIFGPISGTHFNPAVTLVVPDTTRDHPPLSVPIYYRANYRRHIGHYRCQNGVQSKVVTHRITASSCEVETMLCPIEAS